LCALFRKIILMFKVKIAKHNYLNFFLAALLAMLVCTQVFAVHHNFSHHLNFKVDATKNQPAKNHANHNCGWCFLNNFQNQIFQTAILTFVATYFLLAFSSRKFDRVKSAFFLSSKASRAPPVIS
jgi:hypothetical protein